MEIKPQEDRVVQNCNWEKHIPVQQRQIWAHLKLVSDYTTFNHSVDRDLVLQR